MRFRSSSLSSTSSSRTSCSQTLSYFKISLEEDLFYSNQKNQSNCLSNKENILHSNFEIGLKTNNFTKMPPTSIKLPGRQTNNSLSSITGQIVIETPTTNLPGPSTSRKKKAKTEV